MEKIRIITDSNSGISQKEGKERGITVVPMPFFINGEEFEEEITLSQEKFYEILKDDTVDIHTSMPSCEYLTELWESLLGQYDKLLYIPMSSGLSSTCAVATAAAEKYDGRVLVVDNTRISVTQKESVNEARRMVLQGKTAEEIKDYLEATAGRSSIYIMVDTLKYLKKGGRVTAGAAALGTMLHLKPVLSSRGGNFDKFAMPMSVVQAKRKIIDVFTKELGGEFGKEYDEGRMTVSVAHTQNFENAEKFSAELKETFPKLVFRYTDSLSLSVSCHIGPGALAAALAVTAFPEEGF